MATTESVKRARLDVPAEGYERWIDFTTLTQRDADTGRLILLDVKWVERTRSQGRTLRGVDGESYWFPPRPTPFDGRGHVYVRGSFALNSYGFDFDSDDSFTAMDLVNLASAAYDGIYDRVDTSGTSPFRGRDTVAAAA